MGILYFPSQEKLARVHIQPSISISRHEDVTLETQQHKCNT